MNNIMAYNQRIYKANYLIYLIFFISGFPALIYQIVWQRALFTIYGVNIESITVVVAAFMLGLGLGSIVGGQISRNPRIPVLAAFSVTELVIGVYGFNSLRLFEQIGSYTLGYSPLITGMVTFMLILVPTVMMGATLPLLVAYLVRTTRNVGRTIGDLYFFNTLGSAIACICVAVFLMKTYGKTGSVVIAASINLAVSASALLIFYRQRKFPHSPSDEVSKSVAELSGNGPPIPFGLAMMLVFLCGFIALSYEIVWIRVFTIAFTSSAAIFPFVLSMYLIGIAWGASEARRFCPSNNDIGKNQMRALAVFVFLANIFGFLLVPLVARTFQGIYFGVALLLVIPAAAFLGASLPLICHMAVSPDDNTGARISYLYLADIIGATLGTLLTGYVLLDHFSMAHINLFLAFLGFVMVAFLLIPARIEKKVAIPLFFFVGLTPAFLSYKANAMYDQVYERLLFKRDFTSVTRFAHIVENKSGVITVTRDGTAYGEGVYDGIFKVDIFHDTNIIVRPFALSAFHAAPRDVLMIGLATGSWAQVIANNPMVEKLTIVEINPGYLQLIAQYPSVAGLLRNPKVKIVIDDGRRWLSKFQKAKFDAIVMNTTWHWRSFASNLLSMEFLTLVKAHLNEGGIFFYNTTDSPDAQKTGCTMFSHAFRFYNFMLVSDSPLAVDRDRLQDVLRIYRIDGKPVFDLSKTADRSKIKEILSRLETADGRKYQWGDLETKRDILRRTYSAQLITDDNMLTEWQQKPLQYQIMQ